MHAWHTAFQNCDLIPQEISRYTCVGAINLSLLFIFNSCRQIDLQLHLEAELLEEENARALPVTTPQEPNVPNFREIMDTELALAIYEKEVKDEWKNKEPQDMAAQMTRKKLYLLFPDVAHETLSEMLIAHGNSFSATVEVGKFFVSQAIHYF